MVAPEYTAVYDVWSNAFYLLIPIVLAYKRLLWQYSAQVNPILLVTIFSTYYHLCWIDNSQTCPGPYFNHDVSQAMDVFMALNAMISVSIVLDQYLFRRASSKWAPICMGVYCMVTTVLTAFLWIYFGAGNETVITLSCLHGAFLAVAVGMRYHELRTTDPNRSNKVFLLLVLFAFMLGGAGVGSYYADQAEHDGSTYEQGTTYDINHGNWHSFVAGAIALLLCTLPRASITLAIPYIAIVP